jgi:hypothetical protein
LCDEIEELEPKVKELYDSFDTYLDLEKHIHSFWIGFVMRLILLKRKDIVTTPLREHLLIDIKLNHNAIVVKEQTIVKGEIINLIKGKVPVTICELAKILELNNERLKEVLEYLFGNRMYVIGRYIVSFEKRALIKGIRAYCSSDDIAYDGSLNELYNTVVKKYNNEFKEKGIYNYNDFLDFIKRRFNTFSDFMGRRKDNREYELKRYLQKSNTPEFIHPNTAKK